MFIHLSVIYLIFLSIILLVSNYYLLFSKTDHYTRTDLTDFLPFFRNLADGISKIGNPFIFAITVILFSIIGMLIAGLIHSWVTNSAIVFLILLLLIPLLLIGFSDKKDSNSWAINYLIQYYKPIEFGFGTGTGVMIIYNFRALTDISPLFLIANILGVTILNCFVIMRIVSDKD